MPIAALKIDSKLLPEIKAFGEMIFDYIDSPVKNYISIINSIKNPNISNIKICKGFHSCYWSKC